MKLTKLQRELLDDIVLRGERVYYVPFNRFHGAYWFVSPFRKVTKQVIGLIEKGYLKHTVTNGKVFTDTPDVMVTDKTIELYKS